MQICVLKVAVNLWKLLEVMFTSVNIGLIPFNFIRKRFLQISVRKVAVHLKRCWKWYPRASIKAWTRLILFPNTFCTSAFGKSLCIYKTYWKWCLRAPIQAWTCFILFANTVCRSAFGKSLCTYKMRWKWCPWTSIQAWTRLILFGNTFRRSALGKSLWSYKRCWKLCPRASKQALYIYVS
jgi:hypothetical protein